MSGLPGIRDAIVAKLEALSGTDELLECRTIERRDVPIDFAELGRMPQKVPALLVYAIGGRGLTSTASPLLPIDLAIAVVTGGKADTMGGQAEAIAQQLLRILCSPEHRTWDGAASKAPEFGTVDWRNETTADVHDAGCALQVVSWRQVVEMPADVAPEYATLEQASVITHIDPDAPGNSPAPGDVYVDQVVPDPTP